MTSNVRVFMLMVAVIALFVLTQVLFIIMPAQAGLVVHLGSLNTLESGEVKVYKPGLHVKLPIIDRLTSIDTRLQSFDVPSTRVLTQDQKSVFVDYYTKWYVSDFSTFYKTTGADFFRAEEILKRKISDALRAEFGRRTLSDIISGDERNQIIQQMQQKASLSAENLGLKVLDVRLKRVDYPQEVTLSVYERMKSSRHREAKRYRSEGQAESEKVKAEADKDASIIIAESKREAAERVAEGKKEAIEIYNAAYSKAPDFYEFYIKMQAYNASVKNNELMILSPDQHEFFALLSSNK